MSNDTAATRKQTVFKILRLWNEMPYKTLGAVLEEAFEINVGDFRGVGSQEVGRILDECIDRKLTAINNEQMHKKMVKDKQSIASSNKHTSEDYVAARIFLNELKQYIYILTKQEYQRLKGMALNGGMQEARKELYKICEQKQAAIDARKKAAVAGRK